MRAGEAPSVNCPADHFNRAGASFCTVCGLPIDKEGPSGGAGGEIPTDSRRGLVVASLAGLLAVLAAAGLWFAVDQTGTGSAGAGATASPTTQAAITKSPEETAVAAADAGEEGPADESNEPSPEPVGETSATPSEACIGASACAFENGIKPGALVREVGEGTGFSSGDINCNEGAIAYNRVPAGDTFRCAVDARPPSPQVEVVVTETAPYFQLVQQPSVAEVYGANCESKVQSVYDAADDNGSIAMESVKRESGVTSHLYLLAFRRTFFPGGQTAYSACGEPGLSEATTIPYPGTPSSHGDGIYGDLTGPVAQIQDALVSKLYWIGGGPTGKFDQATHEAVRRFQLDNGLAADGVVGANTWQLLFAGRRKGRADVGTRLNLRALGERATSDGPESRLSAGGRDLRAVACGAWQG